MTETKMTTPATGSDFCPSRSSESPFRAGPGAAFEVKDGEKGRQVENPRKIATKIDPAAPG